MIYPFRILFILFATTLASAAQDSETPPNILFIAIDDLNDWVGCLNSHPQVQTPNMDALAKRGTLFTNAHCQAPLCNPSRTSVMTGLRPSTTGVYGLAPWFRTVDEIGDLVTLPQHFSNAGYTTYTVGKIYHGKGWNSSGIKEFDVVGKTEPGLRPKEKRVTTPRGGRGMDWAVYPYKETDHKDWKTASWAVEQLDNKPEDPFFMAVGFSLPHVPLLATQKWFDLYPEDDVILPRMLLDDRSDTPRFSWYLHWKLPEPRQKFLLQHGEQIKIVQAYLASVSFVDSQVGRVLDALEQNGQADNTIVVLWSDHGYHLGEKQITGKNTLWDRSARVPLIFSGPGIEGGQSCSRSAELLDIYPTLSELCGLEIPDHLEGLSLAPQLKDAKAPRSRPAITTHNHDNHGIRTEKWRYIQYADGSEELYDIVKDPNEFTNLAADSKYITTKSALKKHLPKINKRPVPGSAKRILTYENGLTTWEGKDIKPGDAIPRLTMTNERLDELIQKYVLGNLSESEATELSDHLERDDAADSRRKLRLALRADAYLQEAASDMDVSGSQAQQKKFFSLERILWPLGSIAAAIAIGIFTWSQGPDTQQIDDLRVGTIHRIEGEAQNHSGDTLLNGGALQAEDRITMEAGLVEIVFRDTGVHAVATAPLSMTIHSSEKVFLERGDLKLHVPPQGIGFVVETAEREITDLGTSFVVTAGNGESRVLVLDGLVSVDKKPGAREQYLAEGEAATFTQKGDLKMLVKKVRTMPELTPSKHSDELNLLPGQIYTLRQGELPQEKEQIDLLGQRFLPLVKSGFQDPNSLAKLRTGQAPFPFYPIAGAYNQFAANQGIDQETIERSGWMSWHTGKLRPPKSGRYRFWGYADNNLVVAIDGRPVFEGGRYDAALRQSAGVPRQNHPAWPCLNSAAGFASGPWFEAGDTPVQFDLLFGEKRGNLTYGLLLIESEGDTYEETFYGQPKWPLFLTGIPDSDYREQLNQLNAYLEEKLLGSFSVSDRAIWKVEK